MPSRAKLKQPRPQCTGVWHSQLRAELHQQLDQSRVACQNAHRPRLNLSEPSPVEVLEPVPHGRMLANMRTFVHRVLAQRLVVPHRATEEDSCAASMGGCPEGRHLLGAATGGSCGNAEPAPAIQRMNLRAITTLVRATTSPRIAEATWPHIGTASRNATAASQRKISRGMLAP